VDASQNRVVVSPINPTGIVLNVAGKPVFRLNAKYYCELNEARKYLAVEQSVFTVFHHATTEPILRYDFIRTPSGTVPSAHINMHTQSDALVRAMADAGTSRRTTKRLPKSDGTIRARPSQLHLPLGGPRFRPALEDVLEMLVAEFSIDRATGWQDSLREGRSLWRDTQLRAAVADNTAAAVDALRELGFAVEWQGAPGEWPELRKRKLEQF
jgi:hypothetical protein